MSRPVAREITRLHEDTGLAAYLSVLRGAELVIVHVVDSPDCPRLPAMHFGFHDVPHATAFGKILLAEQEAGGRNLYLDRHGMRALTANTLTDRDELDYDLRDVALRGIAWEREVRARLQLRRRAGARRGCGSARRGGHLGSAAAAGRTGARHRGQAAPGGPPGE